MSSAAARLWSGPCPPFLWLTFAFLFICFFILTFYWSFVTLQSYWTKQILYAGFIYSVLLYVPEVNHLNSVWDWRVVACFKCIEVLVLIPKWWGELRSYGVSQCCIKRVVHFPIVPVTLEHTCCLQQHCSKTSYSNAEKVTETSM